MEEENKDFQGGFKNIICDAKNNLLFSNCYSQFLRKIVIFLENKGNNYIYKDNFKFTILLKVLVKVSRKYHINRLINQYFLPQEFLDI